MPGLKIITVCYSTPEFVEYQFKLLSLLNGDFEYIVYDNSCTSDVTMQHHSVLVKLCDGLGIKRKNVDKKAFSSMIDGEVQYPNMDASQRAGRAITWAIQDCIKSENPDRILLLDTDLFVLKEYDLNSIPFDVAGIPVNTGKYSYFTNQLFYVDLTKIEDTSKIDFNPCTINGTHLDCGGKMHDLFSAKNLRIGGFNNKMLSNTSEVFSSIEGLEDFATKDLELIRGSMIQTNYFVELYEYAFLHFRSGTNWLNIKEYEQRKSKLFDFLKTKINTL